MKTFNSLKVGTDTRIREPPRIPSFDPLFQDSQMSLVGHPLILDECPIPKHYIQGQNRVKWQFKMADVTDSGVLTTASDLVFAGGREGYFYALDARTGAVLWKGMTGGQISAGPVTYAVDGKQYVSVAAGNAIFTYSLRDQQ